MSLSRASLRRLAARLPGDRRVCFHDLSDPRTRGRSPRSRVLQLYSAHPNIGNYTPVLGIHALLGHAPDAWCAHRPLDFDLLHRHYRCLIVGGAGLLHPVFEPLWRDLATSCRLPIAIWGVGGCFPDADRDGARTSGGICPSAPEVARRASLVNVRDDLSADRLGVAGTDIGICPTVEYLAQRFDASPKRRERVLYSAHRELVGDRESMALARCIRGRFAGAVVTDNVQSRWEGVHDLIRRRYRPSRLVVTSRLHGAIIAWGLGIPWVALARDEKLRAFGRLYGGGVACDDLERLEAALADLPEPADPALARDGVRRFAGRVRTWLRDQRALPAESASGWGRRGWPASVS